MDISWNLQFGFAPALAMALLHSLWQGALLAATAAVALRLLARHGAALRHAVALAFLLAMVAMPAAGFARFWSRPATELNAGLVPAMSAPVIGPSADVFVQQSNGMAAAVSLLWLAGVAVMLLRQLGGWRLVGMLERHPFRALPVEWQQRVDALQRALRISRAVSVRLADDVLAPFTARLLRPVIWLPGALLERLPRAQLEALLAHELAHVRRLDWLWNGLQCVVEALLFFHPAAWWLGRRIRQEREHACDDLAVAACGDAIALAEALVELEHHRQPLPRLLLAAHGGSLMTRITRLLSTPPARRGRWAPLAIALLLGSGVVLATQLDPARHQAPDVRIESSTDGTLRPGDFRRITATGLDKRREYEANVGADGAIAETYRENGEARPIDADVRTWIDEVSRLSVPPPPPLPPAPPSPASPASPASPPSPASPASPASPPSPPSPPSPMDDAAIPAPPAPPPPPAPPSITEASDFKAILRLVAADPEVATRVGQPLAVLPDSVDGHVRLDGRNDQDGEARLSFVLSGPLGRARVLVSATRAVATWTVDTLDVRPYPG